MTSPAVDQTLHYARRNWPLLAAIVAGAIGWGTTSAKVEAMEKDLGEVEEVASEIVDHRVAVARMEADVAAIKNALRDMNEEHRAFSSELRDIELSLDRNFGRMVEILLTGRDEPES